MEATLFSREFAAMGVLILGDVAKTHPLSRVVRVSENGVVRKGLLASVDDASASKLTTGPEPELYFALWLVAARAWIWQGWLQGDSDAKLHYSVPR